MPMVQTGCQPLPLDLSYHTSTAYLPGPKTPTYIVQLTLLPRIEHQPPNQNPCSTPLPREKQDSKEERDACESRHKLGSTCRPGEGPAAVCPRPRHASLFRPPAQKPERTRHLAVTVSPSPCFGRTENTKKNLTKRRPDPVPPPTNRSIGDGESKSTGLERGMNVLTGSDS